MVVERCRGMAGGAGTNDVLGIGSNRVFVELQQCKRDLGQTKWSGIDLGATEERREKGERPGKGEGQATGTGTGSVLHSLSKSNAHISAHPEPEPD